MDHSTEDASQSLEADITAEARRSEILLVEDDLGDAELVRETLREHQINCSLRVVHDGAQAIAFLNAIDTDPKAPALDLILLDMGLPKRDGGAVLRRLRSTERYAQTPVIVISGLATSAVEEAATRNAALMYFKKPSTLDEIHETWHHRAPGPGARKPRRRRSEGSRGCSITRTDDKPRRH